MKPAWRSLQRKWISDLKTRQLTPEILDELPADDPEAIRSRRDLRMVNFLMGNYQRICRQLATQSDVIHWVELGAGTGSFADYLDAESKKKMTVTGVDFGPRPGNWPDHWNWYQGDLFEFLKRDTPEFPESCGIIANLFLHHFADEQLIQLGNALRSKFVRMVAVEPVRRMIHCRIGSLLFPLINRVTRHDMRVSIEAGFRGEELGKLLIRDDDQWETRVEETWLGSHFFSAGKRIDQ